MRTLFFSCDTVRYFWCIFEMILTFIFVHFVRLCWILQQDDASKLHTELLHDGLEKWTRSTWESKGGKIRGIAKLNSFGQAFNLLVHPNASGNFQHAWFSNWSWIQSVNSNRAFFEEMDEKLNDDCMREVFEYLDPLYLVYLAQIDARFADLISQKKQLRIFPTTAGPIHYMNFRYFLETFSSLTELILSLNCFPRTFNIYPTDTKRLLIEIISKYCGQKLKRICLYDFNFSEHEIQEFRHYFDILSIRGIDVSIYNFAS